MDKRSKNGFVGRGLLKFYVAPTFQALLENCHQFDLDACVRRLVAKNGEFEGRQ